MSDPIRALESYAMGPIQQLKNEIFSTVPSVIYHNRHAANLRLKRRLIEHIATIIDQGCPCSSKSCSEHGHEHVFTFM